MRVQLAAHGGERVGDGIAKLHLGRAVAKGEQPVAQRRLCARHRVGHCRGNGDAHIGNDDDGGDYNDDNEGYG